MPEVQQVQVPEGSFLDHFARQDGVYADCFAVEINSDIAFGDYIEAFYTTPLFKAERLILRLIAKAPSTDDEARLLGIGDLDKFAIWRVKERAESQLLMKAVGRTSSWFMTVPVSPGRTRLMFGSVVVPHGYPKPGAAKMGFGFSALLGLHKLYSRRLLASARKRLLRSQNP
ncbi:MAG: hypothetical protein P1U83_02320 [Roseovarius sp.]|nr:hypothetical protein [Roseovarius sp.]